ncbi:MAG: hypothetical protein AB8B91_13125 [Rubripirellula sp.]
MDELGESWMRWSVRFAVLCIYMRWMILLRRRDLPVAAPGRAACWVWSIGCAASLFHVSLAFHFVHDWSHRAAWNHTAAETMKLVGVQRGDGLWVNYAFSLIWVADCIRLWKANFRGKSTSSRLDCLVFCLFLFIVVNATVVFGPAFYRPIAIVAILLAAILWGTRVGRFAADP